MGDLNVGGDCQQNIAICFLNERNFSVPTHTQRARRCCVTDRKKKQWKVQVAPSRVKSGVCLPRQGKGSGRAMTTTTKKKRISKSESKNELSQVGLQSHAPSTDDCTASHCPPIRSWKMSNKSIEWTFLKWNFVANRGLKRCQLTLLIKRRIKITTARIQECRRRHSTNES